MPGGDRNSKGRPIDFVFHLSFDEGKTTLCGRKEPNIHTDGTPKYGAATCMTCIKKSQEFAKLWKECTETNLFTGGTTGIQFKKEKDAIQFMNFIKWQQKQSEKK